MSLIWATRGRTWGFRFLRRGGLSDPLPRYRAAFADFEGQREVFSRAGGAIALRFQDPAGRTDDSGRVIPHDFVLSGVAAAGIDSLAAGVQSVWPLVESEYALKYDLSEPDVAS